MVLTTAFFMPPLENWTLFWDDLQVWRPLFCLSSGLWFQPQILNGIEVRIPECWLLFSVNHLTTSAEYFMSLSLSHSIQFSFIYITPNYNKCHLRALQWYSPIQANWSSIHCNHNPIPIHSHRANSKTISWLRNPIGCTETSLQFSLPNLHYF